MSDPSGLTFGEDGFVDMEAFPDLDPDLALDPVALGQLHDALVDAPVPVPNEADWASMVQQVVASDPGDLLPADAFDGIEGTTSVTDDGPGFEAPMAEAETETEAEAVGEVPSFDDDGWAGDEPAFGADPLATDELDSLDDADLAADDDFGGES